ncbi:enoyl-CoA hydratase/isomerase family protein [Acidiferrimicrobium sp. IK]|uniref:enoyl-CoA hydratase/isomerase family protein n=1 Tax=Acidiferrimicrobium sp. IK TaxID=2871700 RepID=UPI0021CB7C95|nr:enoyl-CoA hydratase/isomerase family protein [Acidiferrimicrobium sp. IK]MCU4183890.1 enoyl-CoA hydratase/isomerase family protein [Acidiferrimicrobium sp. IK]
MSAVVQIGRDGPVVTVTLDRPRALNAVTAEMKVQLLDALEAIRRDTTVGIVVLTGAGRGFCAGADRDELFRRRTGTALDALAGVETTQQIVEQLAHMNAVTIARVNGVVAGGGLGLALACDLTVASAEARVVLSFLDNGLVPDASLAVTLRAALGARAARQLLLTYDEISAEHAGRLGLFGDVVAPGAFDERIQSLTHKLGTRSSLALALTKRLYADRTDLLMISEALAQTVAITHKRNIQ